MRTLEGGTSDYVNSAKTDAIGQLAQLVQTLTNNMEGFQDQVRTPTKKRSQAATLCRGSGRMGHVRKNCLRYTKPSSGNKEQQQQ